MLTKDWYHNPDDVLSRLEKLLQGHEGTEKFGSQDEEPDEAVAPAASEKAAPTTSVRPRPAGESPPGGKKMAKGVEPPPVPASVSVPGSVRHFEFIGGASRKFWEISQSGNSFTVRFGRLGTAGQSQTKTFADEAKAKREADHWIAEKLRKGYVEKG